MVGKNRYINTKFWDDNYIVNLDPIEKLLFLYILTNPLTNIAGIYEIALKRIAFDTGIDSEMVNKIFKRFANDKKIYYIENHIIICNFPKHQDLNNERINKAIQNILDKTNDNVLMAIHNLSIPYLYPMVNLNLNINLNSNLNTKEKVKLQSCNNSTPINTPKETPNNHLDKEKFEVFRKKYPGTKRGLDTEYDNFIKKNKKDIIELLLPAIENQVEVHNKKKEQDKFCPEWKHLQTWINQKCWEEETEVIEKEKSIQERIAEGRRLHALKHSTPSY